MEEDIKLLEEYIKALKQSMSFKYTNEQKAQAIENLINRNKTLEKENYDLKDITQTYNAVVSENLEKDVKMIIADRRYFANGYYRNNFISKDKIREKIEELEQEQEQNRKELARGIDYLSDLMIDNASDKIVINMSIREYLQELLQEGDK